MEKSLSSQSFNKREVGNKGEEKAVKFLESINYQILVRNFYSRYGEIDIIAQDKSTIVFIEVKYRRSGNYGKGAEAISKKKISAIIKTAKFYLMSEDIDCRFDVISIDENQINHIISAFDYCD